MSFQAYIDNVETRTGMTAFDRFPSFPRRRESRFFLSVAKRDPRLRGDDEEVG